MKRKDNFVMQNVGGENLLVPLGAQVMDMNGLVTLNDTAAYLWTLLAENRTTSELIAALTVEFDVDEAAARADVEAFLSDIDRIGLLDS